jgi:hypothetical protein
VKWTDSVAPTFALPRGRRAAVRGAGQGKPIAGRTTGQSYRLGTFGVDTRLNLSRRDRLGHLRSSYKPQRDFPKGCSSSQSSAHQRL